MPVDFTPYSTVKEYVTANLPGWLHDELEQLRYASYQFYEQVYWNVPETFKITQRGKDQRPIYIPSGKVIVETLHRYMAGGMAFIPDPTLGSDTERALATQVMADLATREKLFSKFSSNKRFGIIRGDWMFHIYADPLRPAGSKISIFPLDPASVFKVTNPDNVDEVIGYHIVDQFTDGSGKALIRRLTYMKDTMQGGPSPITVTDEVYETDKWGGPGMDPEDVKLVEVLRPPLTFPSPIDDLPIYHIRNFDEPNNPYGSSELRGMERLLAAVNQSISDEELTLAMDGLGVYATNAGAPIDEDTGLELPWDLGPAKVVEVPAEAFFNRVSGVQHVVPYQEHLKYLHEQIDLGAGTPSAAKGRVDVQVAESGVALTIEFSPLLAHAAEKELEVNAVLGQMTYNLGKWYSAYEGGSFNSLWEVTRWLPVYAPKLPVNVSKTFEDLLAAVNAKALPIGVFWDQCRKLGIDLPDNKTMMEQLLSESAATASIQADALGARISGELGAAGATLDPNAPANN